MLKTLIAASALALVVPADGAVCVNFFSMTCVPGVNEYGVPTGSDAGGGCAAQSGDCISINHSSGRVTCTTPGDSASAWTYEHYTYSNNCTLVDKGVLCTDAFRAMSPLPSACQLQLPDTTSGIGKQCIMPPSNFAYEVDCGKSAATSPTRTSDAAGFLAAVVGLIAALAT